MNYNNNNYREEKTYVSAHTQKFAVVIDIFIDEGFISKHLLNFISSFFVRLPIDHTGNSCFFDSSFILLFSFDTNPDSIPFSMVETDNKKKKKKLG